jgi:hypothetical protein
VEALDRPFQGVLLAVGYQHRFPQFSDPRVQG